MNDSDLMLCFEEEHSMFDKSIAGIHYWQLIRMALFTEVLNFRVEIKNRHPDFTDSYSGINMVKGGCALLYHSFFKGSYKQAEGKIVICTARREKSQAEQLVRTLKDACFMLDRPNKFMHLSFLGECGIAYSDILDFHRSVLIKFLQLVPTNFGKRIKDELNTWYKEFNEFMGVKVPYSFIQNRMIHAVISEKIITAYYKRKFKKYRPCKVVLYPCYEVFNAAMVKVCHCLNIPVIELQHGYTNTNDIIYSYAKEHTEYFPDKVLMFGDYWRDCVNYPNKERFISCGSIVLEASINQYKNKEKENLIVFISQGPYADIIYPIAVHLCNILEKKKQLDQYDIVYKLHPNEVLSWDKLHPDYHDSRMLITGDQWDIYELLSRAKMQIGIDSTALFEGIAFGAKTVIIDCDQLGEDMRKFSNKYHTLLTDNVEEIYRYITDMDNISIDTESEYIWKNNALQNVIKEIWNF